MVYLGKKNISMTKSLLEKLYLAFYGMEDGSLRDQVIEESFNGLNSIFEFH